MGWLSVLAWAWGWAWTSVMQSPPLSDCPMPYLLCSLSHLSREYMKACWWASHCMWRWAMWCMCWLLMMMKMV